MQVDNYYSLINSLRDNFGNLIVPEWRDFSLVELPDYGDIDTVEGMRRYIRKHKESPYSKTGGQGLASYTPVPQSKNRVIKISSLQEIPICLYGKQVYLYLKDHENTIVIKHLFINVINGKVLADYDINKYQVIGYCENLDL